MLIRYKWWNKDGMESHTVSVPGYPEGKVTFFDSEEGIADVRNKAAIEKLLADSYNYEVAYGEYGMSFDDNGWQLDQEIQGVVTVINSVSTAGPEVNTVDVDYGGTVRESKKRGRPAKKR